MFIEVLSSEPDQLKVLHNRLEQYIVYVYHFTELPGTTEYYLQKEENHFKHDILFCITVVSLIFTGFKKRDNSQFEFDFDVFYAC